MDYFTVPYPCCIFVNLEFESTDDNDNNEDLSVRIKNTILPSDTNVFLIKDFNNKSISIKSNMNPVDYCLDDLKPDFKIIIIPKSTATIVSTSIPDPIFDCYTKTTNVAADIQDKPYKPLIKNNTNAYNYQWYFDSYSKGHLHSVINKNKCLYLDDVTNGKINVDILNHVKKQRIKFGLLGIS
ncbi:hypothetical protein PIROE2DRAFT_11819 [Piromyces sp. E2]|nr:hypothetical protein PIROE2DRAFT_11819 [Piromyces sp. E2]|eukprot:OUM62002.1 hypothetical protein PIROE2DRAFT_11819 [Piromyces sp. E2]